MAQELPGIRIPGHGSLRDPSRDVNTRAQRIAAERRTDPEETRRRILGVITEHRRARLAAVLGSVGALSLCAVAACALFVPGFVMGAERPVEAPVATTAAPSAAGGGGAGASADSFLPNLTAVPDSAAPSTGSLLVTLPWGSGAGQVGLRAPAEGLTSGPEALAVAPDGRVAVLDSVNERVVLLEPSGAFASSVAVSLAAPRFLAATNDRLYVLDCDSDRRLLTLDWAGTVLEELVLPDLEDVVTGLFATDSGPCIEVAHKNTFLMTTSHAGIEANACDASASAAAGNSGEDRRTPAAANLQPLQGRPLDARLGRVAKVAFELGKTAQVELFKVDKTSLNASLLTRANPVLVRGQAIEHLISADGDGNGGLVIGARLLNSKPGSQNSSLLLTRWPGGLSEVENLSSHTGEAQTQRSSRARGPRALVLTDSTFAYVGQPYVIAPDGRVVQPVAGPDGYSLLVHNFDQDGEVQP